LDAKYKKADIDTVIAEQTHLTKAQKNDLHAVLSNHEKLFNGELGLYPHKKVHIYVNQDAIPVHARPYPVPHLHLETFKCELDHLCVIGVLSKQGASEWASPSFIAPKKDGHVRWISDLRALNKVIKRKQYLLGQVENSPNIPGVLKQHGNTTTSTGKVSWSDVVRRNL